MFPSDMLKAGHKISWKWSYRTTYFYQPRAGTSKRIFWKYDIVKRWISAAAVNRRSCNNAITAAHFSGNTCSCTVPVEWMGHRLHALGKSSRAHSDFDKLHGRSRQSRHGRPIKKKVQARGSCLKRSKYSEWETSLKYVQQYTGIYKYIEVVW